MTDDPWRPSFRDPDGCTIVPDERVLRLVGEDTWQTLREFENSNSGRRLLAEGAVLPWQRLEEQAAETAVEKAGIAARTLDEPWEVVLQHEKVAIPSFPHEWPAAMLHAAGRATLRIQSEILGDGFRLKDATLRDRRIRRSGRSDVPENLPRTRVAFFRIERENVPARLHPAVRHRRDGRRYRESQILVSFGFEMTCDGGGSTENQRSLAPVFQTSSGTGYSTGLLKPMPPIPARREEPTWG